MWRNVFNHLFKENLLFVGLQNRGKKSKNKDC